MKAEWAPKAAFRNGVRDWLSTKATTIDDGTHEIQLHIVANRVHGLPESMRR